jgi:hypothetical protein
MDNKISGFQIDVLLKLINGVELTGMELEVSLGIEELIEDCNYLVVK